MGKTSRKRKFLVLFGLLGSLVLVLLVAAPLWFPWVLPSILKSYGITYSRYERDGYSRFIMHNVRFQRDETKFQAGQIAVLFPTSFLWRNFKDDRSENYLRVSDWSLELARAPDDKKSETNSVLSVAKQTDEALEQLDRWIPKAIFDNGTIRFEDQQFAVPVAEWAGGNLVGRMSSEELSETFFSAHLGRKAPKGILIENPLWNLGGELLITRSEEDFLQIEGKALWLSNRVDLAARFGRKGWWPETASVKCDSFRIPAQTIRLEGYHDVTGTLDLQWKTNGFGLDLKAHAQPIHHREIFLSPLTAVVHASGNTNSIRVETAAISSPWLAASLSTNAEFNFRGELLSPKATLKINADLAGQHWINATGHLEGEAVLRRGTNRFPDAAFSLSGVGLGIEAIEMDQLEVQGRLDWPWLQIDPARIRFTDGATAEANLRFNAVAREIAGGQLHFNGSFGHKFLPPEISYRDVALSGKFSGPLKNLSHSGQIELQGSKFPNLAPLAITADWRGRWWDLEFFEANLTSKDSTLSLRGSGKFATNQIEARLDELVLRIDEAPVLSLEKPFAVSSTKTTGEKSRWTVAVEPVRWQGNETEILLSGKIQWPEQGDFSLAARQLAFSRFRDFFEQALPEVFIDNAGASGNWNNGPATFSLNGIARFFAGDGTPFSTELRGNGNEEGITLEVAKVGTAVESIVSGSGFLPLLIVPGAGSNVVQVLPKQRIDFQAKTIPNAQFWEQLAAWTQTDLREPRAALSISGTFDAPQGKLTASVKEVVFQPKDPSEPVPRLQNLLADFDLAREQIRLNRFEVFVEGQPVTAAGTLPLPKNLETNWKKIFDWRKANIDLKIVDAQIAPFERLFPKILSPLGTVNLDLAMAGGKLDGELRVADAALRPIPSLGPVHDIAARMKFRGEQIALETFSGNIGGQPVNVSGQINLGKRTTNGLPDFNFKLRGTNVPLTRSPELILRSDLDLAIANDKGGEPVVSGELNLRDSYYLSDLKLLVPGKVAKPDERPPYFSVETQPLAKWHLDVAVRGTNFLKVRSPLFRGELSSNLKLSGTLREPVAMGDGRINSGVVQFPFANLRVDRGFVTLTSENPYRPKLSIAASARTFGYDVKMEVSGFADQPVIEFSSSPGLTSEQILLMVTAGELPRDEFNFSTEQKAGRLAFFLGKNLISKFGATDAQDDKLEIRSGENLSEQGRQTYYLEYRLTDEWSIIGEYDRFGGVNAGFKWKFFQK